MPILTLRVSACSKALPGAGDEVGLTIFAIFRQEHLPGHAGGAIRFIIVHWLPGPGTLMVLWLYRTEHHFVVGGKLLAERRDHRPRGAFAVSRKM